MVHLDLPPGDLELCLWPSIWSLGEAVSVVCERSHFRVCGGGWLRFSASFVSSGDIPLSLRSFGHRSSLRRCVHGRVSYCMVTVGVVVFTCGLRLQTSGGLCMTMPWSLSGSRPSSFISVSAPPFLRLVGFSVAFLHRCWSSEVYWS